tara:strand:+ start:897 stop:1937 length:1041 start_codon:yes stop_codon:yes gene_type:complete
MVGFFWIGLALDFPALENAMIGLTTKHVVGYEVSVLLGSDARDEIVDKVFRTELVFSLLLSSYSVLILGLAFAKGLFRRLKFLALGLGIPLLSLLLLFWVKFLSEDHIISSSEKTDLFMLSIIGVSVGIALCWFGLLRFSRTTKISLDDVDLPSEIVENKLTEDLLDELRDRDQGDVVDGIESEKEPSLSESKSDDSADPAETTSEVPSEVTKVEEPFREAVPEAVSELSSETLLEDDEPNPIEEVMEVQPLVEETEDFSPSSLPEIAEELPDEIFDEEVPETAELPPETLSETDESNPAEEVVEAQAAVTGEFPSDPSDVEFSSDIHKSTNSRPLDHKPTEVQED